MDELFDTYTLKIRFTEPVLGTQPFDRLPFTGAVKDRARRQADERVPIPAEEAETRGHNTFYVDDAGRPGLFDYQIKGALKEAANTIKEVAGVRNLRHHVEQTVFVEPRFTPLADQVDGELERPLRAMTPIGPRVTVVKSDMVEPRDEPYTFQLRVLKGSKVTRKVLDTILAYWAYKGIGQWRNGGYGRAEAWIVDDADTTAVA